MGHRRDRDDSGVGCVSDQQQVRRCGDEDAPLSGRERQRGGPSGSLHVVQRGEVWLRRRGLRFRLCGRRRGVRLRALIRTVDGGGYVGCFVLGRCTLRWLSLISFSLRVRIVGRDRGRHRIRLALSAAGERDEQDGGQAGCQQREACRCDGAPVRSRRPRRHGERGHRLQLGGCFKKGVREPRPVNEGAQRVDDVVRVLGPSVRLAVEEGANECREIWRHVGAAGGEVGRVLGQTALELRHGGGAEERRLPGQEFEEHAAEGVQIAARVDIANRDLRRCVRKRAEKGALDRERVVRFMRSDPEVRDPDGAVAHEKDVGRLQIAVHDAFALRVGERLGDLASNQRRVRDCEWRRGLNQSSEGWPVDELHDEIGLAVLTAGVERANDVRRTDGGGDPGLPLETAPRVRLLSEVRMEQLECARLTRSRVADGEDAPHSS